MSKFFTRLVAILLLSSLSQPTLAEDTHPFELKSKDGNFSIRPEVQSQFRYTFLNDQNGADTSTFDLRRVRLAVMGHALTPNLKYVFRFAYDNNNPSLLDFFADYKINKHFAIKTGQYKVPYTREFLVSALKSAFVEYTNQFNQFGLNRDMGITLHGDVFPGLHYNLYVFNGNNRAANANQDFFVGGRLNWNILGKAKYHAYDFEISEKPKLQLGGGFVYDFGDDSAAIQGHDTMRGTLDAQFLFHGFQLSGEGHWLRNRQLAATDWGYHAQTSYFLIPKRLLLAARSAGTIRRDGGAFAQGNLNTYEHGGALSTFFYKDQIKTVLDYHTLVNNGLQASQRDHQIRIQFQWHFR